MANLNAFSLRLLLTCCLVIATRGQGCSKNLAYVCSLNGTTYDNACLAHADSALIAYPGACIQECSSCSLEWAPVCVGEGANATTYGSTCFAKCNGAESVPPEAVGYPCSQTQDGGCACVAVYDPVCGADNKTYSNRGCAGCWEVPVLSEGECPPKDDPAPSGGSTPDGPSDLSPQSSDCSDTCLSLMDTIEDPVCVVNPCNRSSPSKGFKNTCKATCEGGAKPQDLYYKGPCNAVCDELCNQGHKKSVCCGSGVEYPNLCYAECVGGLDAKELKTCKKGQCRGSQAVNLGAGCVKGGVAARCFVDPCQVSTCSVKKATCLSIYCTTSFRLTLLDGICQAAWIDKKGNLLSDEDCK